MIPITQMHFAAPTTFTLPDSYPALLTGETELYEVVNVSNLTQLQIGEEVITSASWMRKRVLPTGVPITVTPGTGGGTLHVTKPGAALPGLSLTPIAPSRAECGVLGGDDDTEGGVTSYALSFTPMRPPGSATAPDARVRLGTTTLPTDAVIEVRNASNTLIATLTVQEQVKDQLGRRWAYLRGPWSSPFSSEAHTVTLKRSGGSTFTGNVTPLTATDPYDGYKVGATFNTVDGVTVQRTASGITEAWPASPQIQFGVFPPLVSALRGTTAQRPTTDLYGLAYFDTDLGRPVFRRSDGVYVDATGTPA